MKKNGFTLCLLFCLGLIAPAKAQNNAVVFDGVNDFVDLGNSSLLNANTIRTMECWVKFNSLATDQEILSKSLGGNGIELLLFGGNLAAYYMNGANTSYITYSGSSLVTGRWYHIATAWDGTKENIKLYVNGASVGTLTHVGNITSSGISNAASSFKIGQWSDPTGRPLNGTVDEVRIWSVNRTATQLKQRMYNVPANSTGLVAYYKANEGTGTTLTNSTANAGLNGTLTNGPTWTASPVQYGANGLQFDAVNDYVTVPGNSAYDFTTGTVEFWARPDAFTASVNHSMFGNRGAGGTRWSFHMTASTLGFFNGTYQTLATTFNTGTWYHLAFVISPASTTAYVNGTLLGTYSLGPGPGTLQTLVMGRVKDATEYEPFNGALDEVRIWNTTRTPTELNTYKNVSLTGTETGLVALYSLDQGINGGNNAGLSVAIDNSPTSNNGTLVNFALSSTISNYVASPLTALPVTYTSFIANKKGNSSVLQWQTQQEQNSASYIIERSTDGKEFTGIGQVAAAGNSSVVRSYSFTDETPAAGKNYYRLNQVDLDGRSNYSTIKIVDFAASAKLTWYAAGNSIQVILDNGNNEPYQLTDMRGSLIQKGRLTNGRIRFNGLRSGTYSIQVQSDSPIRKLFVVK
jgi:hypothetical protein